MVLHATWLTIAVSALVMALLFGNEGANPLLFLLISALTPSFVILEVACGISLGVLAGIGVALGAPLTRNHLVLGLIGGTFSGLGLALTASALGRSLPTSLWWLYLPYAFVGGVATLIALRRSGPPDTSAAMRWALAALLFGGCAVWQAIFLLNALLDPTLRYRCAMLTQSDVSELRWVSSELPPQIWCLTPAKAIAVNPVWGGPALAGLLTGFLVCVWLAIARGQRLQGRWAITGLTALVLMGVVVALVWWQPSPAPDAPRHEFATPYTPPGPTPTPTPSPTPPPTAANARATVEELSRSAVTAMGTTLLWPLRPTITEITCELPSGTPGIMYLLDGRFTTRAMALVNGPQEMAQVSKANEVAAKQIVDAWVASGLVAGPEMLHGEWWLGPPPGTGVIDQAHVGFEQAVGLLHVSSRCASKG